MADENAAPVVDEVKVDESSVKPDAARRNSLEKHLAQRPERAELVESKTTHLNLAGADHATPLRKWSTTWKGGAKSLVCNREHLARLERGARAAGPAKRGTFLPAFMIWTRPLAVGVGAIRQLV